MIGQFGVRTVAGASTQAHVYLARRYQDEVSSECQSSSPDVLPDTRSASDVPLGGLRANLRPRAACFEKFFHETLSRWWIRPFSVAVGAIAAGPSRPQHSAAANSMVRDSVEAYFKEGATAPRQLPRCCRSRLVRGLRFTRSEDRPGVSPRPPAEPVVRVARTPPDAVSTSRPRAIPARRPSALQGPWALFRLLDGARSSRVCSDTRYRVTFTPPAGHSSCRLRLPPAATRSDRILHRFRCTILIS